MIIYITKKRDYRNYLAAKNSMIRNSTCIAGAVNYKVFKRFKNKFGKSNIVWYQNENRRNTKPNKKRDSLNFSLNKKIPSHQ